MKLTQETSYVELNLHKSTAKSTVEHNNKNIVISDFFLLKNSF